MRTATLLRWALIWLVLCVITGFFAFGNVRPNVEEVATGFFALFGALFVVSLGLYARRRQKEKA